MRLRTWQSDDLVNIEISDDGGGIDFDAVRAAAVARGIPVSEDTSLVDLIFQDGVSTRAEVTDLSGRGVGLSATLEACTREGGEVSVVTELGRGTRFVFSFRRPIVKTGQLASSLERRWSLAPSSVLRGTTSDAPASAERQTA